MSLIQLTRRPRGRIPGRERIVIETNLGLGDIVALSGIIRDLHHSQPGAFTTELRTSYPEVWFNNPYAAPFDGSDADSRFIGIDLLYLPAPGCQEVPSYSGVLRRELAEKLGCEIHSNREAGEIHLSMKERRAEDPVMHLLGAPVPYWVMGAGGKYDATTKWWALERYQAVVDHFRDRLLFVQVGLREHHHKPLSGVLDLRGRTSLRELIRLLHAADGVVCGRTSYVHLAAAIPRKDPEAGPRPCVIVGGGREQLGLFVYPGQELVENTQTFPCSGGGCWKSRVAPLNDGSHLDAPKHLCLTVANGIAGCMEAIPASMVIDRIEGYVQRGAARFLNDRELTVARRAYPLFCG